MLDGVTTSGGWSNYYNKAATALLPAFSLAHARGLGSRSPGRRPSARAALQPVLHRPEPGGAARTGRGLLPARRDSYVPVPEPEHRLGRPGRTSRRRSPSTRSGPTSVREADLSRSPRTRATGSSRLPSCRVTQSARWIRRSPPEVRQERMGRPVLGPPLRRSPAGHADPPASCLRATAVCALFRRRRDAGRRAALRTGRSRSPNTSWPARRRRSAPSRVPSTATCVARCGHHDDRCRPCPGRQGRAGQRRRVHERSQHRAQAGACAYPRSRSSSREAGAADAALARQPARRRRCWTSIKANPGHHRLQRRRHRRRHHEREPARGRDQARGVLAAVRRRVVVADSTKLGQVEVAKVCDCSEVSLVRRRTAARRRGRLSYAGVRRAGLRRLA